MFSKCEALGGIETTKQWQAYDPEWLIELARDQHPDKPWLISALSDCTRGCYESRAYIYFVDSKNPNQPGSQLQFSENLLLNTKKGEVVLDILENEKIGGAEFLWLL